MRFNSLLFSITERCSVGCRHCGFLGSRRDQEASPEVVAAWTVTAVNCGFPIVIFTGGEPFERLDALAAGVVACAEAGGSSACFTSSVWAESPATAAAVLNRLPGLTHLYLSTDQYHQERVPLANVYNAIDAALDRAMRVSLNITYGTDTDLQQTKEAYKSYGNSIYINVERVIPNSRVRITKLGEIGAPKPISVEGYGPHCWLSTPLLNPNGDFFACHIGKAAAHRTLRDTPYFLGNLHEQGLAELLERARGRKDYQFLRTHGPRGVAEVLAGDPAVRAAAGRSSFSCDCDMCFATLKTPEGGAALKRLADHEQVATDLRLALLYHEVPAPI